MTANVEQIGAPENGEWIHALDGYVVESIHLAMNTPYERRTEFHHKHRRYFRGIDGNVYLDTAHICHCAMYDTCAGYGKPLQPPPLKLYERCENCGDKHEGVCLS